MKTYEITFYTEYETENSNDGHIIDELTKVVYIQATDDDDAAEQAEQLYKNQSQPYYGFCEIDEN